MIGQQKADPVFCNWTNFMPMLWQTFDVVFSPQRLMLFFKLAQLLCNMVMQFEGNFKLNCWQTSLRHTSDMEKQKSLLLQSGNDMPCRMGFIFIAWTHSTCSQQEGNLQPIICLCKKADARLSCPFQQASYVMNKPLAQSRIESLMDFWMIILPFSQHRALSIQGEKV